MVPNIIFNLHGEKEGGKLLQAYHEQFKAEVVLWQVSGPAFIKPEDGELPKEAELQVLIDSIVAWAEMEVKFYCKVQTWNDFNIW